MIAERPPTITAAAAAGHVSAVGKRPWPVWTLNIYPEMWRMTPSTLQGQIMYYEMLKQLFTPDLIVQRLQNLPPLKLPVMESIFSDRAQLPFPTVAKEEVLHEITELPVVRRGMPSLEMNNEGYEITLYEPLPVRHSQIIHAKELNDLKSLDRGSQGVWVQNTTDRMRRRYLKTVEAICAVALTGKIEWPVHLAGRPEYGTYCIDFGTPETLDMSGLQPWNASGAKVVDVFKMLKAMRKILKHKGYGAEIEIWAGEAAFEQLAALAQVHPEKSSLGVTIEANSINVAGFIVTEREETFRYPSTEALVPVVQANDVLMIAKDAGHKLIYCAVDDLDANLKALPFFIKPVKLDDPSGIKLVSEGKPFPVVNVKGICRATVINA